MWYSRLIAFAVMVAVAVFPLPAKAVQSQDMKPILIAAQKQMGGTIQASQLAISKQRQIPGNIKNSRLKSRISLQSQERQQIDKATKLLVNQQFAALVQQSTSVRPDINVLSRVGKTIRAEAFIVFRAKNTYTATISKLNYDIVDDKVTLTSKVDDYAPPMVALKKPVAVDSATIQIKAKLLADLKIPLPQGYGPKAMANTPCTEFTSAVNATNSVYNTFVSAFGSAQKLLGSQSTKSTIMNVLQNGTRLLAWNNIGHGNPYCVVQWNDERIWNTDFNTTTRFKGIYNSVMLLNSCNVCKSPFALKNAIKQHQPRTYIGGSISLPVGRSELVDVDFWKYSLLQDKTMAWALNKASQDHGLAGAFCLDGFNGMFAVVEAAKFTEDCIPFNPNLIQAKKVNNHWKVVQGSMWMLDFGNSQANANKAVQIIKHYKMDRQCFVGRPNAPMQYYTVGGKAPQGAFGGEDCIPFNPNNVQAQKINNRWKVVDGSHWILDFDKEEAEAKIAVKIIKYYGFKYVCFVGRPNAPMMYFRK